MLRRALSFSVIATRSRDAFTFTCGVLDAHQAAS
jgi:hypothetical protein